MAEGAPAQRGHADDDAQPEPHALRCQAAQTQGFVAAASVALRACLPASPAAAAAAAGRLLEAEEAEPDPETDPVPVPGPDAAEEADAAPVEEAAALSEGNACAALVAAEEAATCSGVGSGVAQQARVLCSAGNDQGAARATLEAEPEPEAEAADEPEEELQLEAGALPPLLLLVLRLS